MLPIETQHTGWYVFECHSKQAITFLTQSPARKFNTPPTSIDDTDILKLYLVNPPVKKIDLHFPLGLEVTARNLKGVTIKDALDAIHKQFKRKVCIYHRIKVSFL